LKGKNMFKKEIEVSQDQARLMSDEAANKRARKIFTRERNFKVAGRNLGFQDTKEAIFALSKPTQLTSDSNAKNDLATNAIAYLAMSAWYHRPRPGRRWPRAVSLFWVLLVVSPFWDHYPIIPLMALAVWVLVFHSFALTTFAFWHAGRLAPLRDLLVRKFPRLVSLPVAVPSLRERWKKTDQSELLLTVLRAMETSVVWGNESEGPVPYVNLRSAAQGIFEVDLEVPQNGHTDLTLMRSFPAVLATATRAVRVVEKDLDPRSGFVTLRIMQRDPLAVAFPEEETPLLHLTREQLEDPYFPLGIGRDMDGELLTRQTFTQNYGSNRTLTLGESGTGKSSVINQVLCFDAVNPHIDLVICDGKGSEFAEFRPYAKRYWARTDNGPTGGTEGFKAVMEFMKEEIARRGQVLSHNKATQDDRYSEVWNHIDDGPYLHWVWDELIATESNMEKNELRDLQLDILSITSVGRSLGVGVDFSSQSYRKEILDTPARDNTFNQSMSFKVKSQYEASNLGFTAEMEYHPAKIKGHWLKNGDFSGAGLYIHVGQTTTEARSYFLKRLTIRAFLEKWATPLNQPVAGVNLTKVISEDES
jgi:hypothetical protein